MGQLILKDENQSVVGTYPIGSVPVLAGRLSSCQINLPSPMVSKKHAAFVENNGICGVKDLNSANGVFVNGARINNAKLLKDGDNIQIAQYRFEYRAAARKANTIRNTRRTPAPPLPADAQQTQNNPPEPHSGHSLGTEPEHNAGGVPPTPTEKIVLTPIESRIANSDERQFKTDTSHRQIKKQTGRLSRRRTGKTKVTRAKAAPNIEETVAPSPSRHPNPSASRGIEPTAVPAARVKDMPEPTESGDEPIRDIKAASEAGLVGEFQPEIEDVPADQADHSATNARMPISEEFRKAIDARLSLYHRLGKLTLMRQNMRTKNPNLPDAVLAELDRQDRETKRIPSAQQATNFAMQRAARKAALEEKQKASGSPPTPSSPEMEKAEALAEQQWMACITADEDDYPKVIAAALRQMGRSNLEKAFSRAKIDASSMFGGAAYFLALESTLEESRALRQHIRDELRIALENKRKTRRQQLSPFAQNNAGEGQTLAPEVLRAREASLDIHIDGIVMEMAELEKKLIVDFWNIYPQAALYLLRESPAGEEELALRLFLRHGAIDGRPWWMSAKVRDHIVRDCSEDVRRGPPASMAETRILYADEYLAEVGKNECTPALDENLELNHRNSPEWKADKTLRRLIYSRSRLGMLREVQASLEDRIEANRTIIAELDDKIAKVLPGAKGAVQTKRELQQKQQLSKVEVAKIVRLDTKIRDEWIPAANEAIADCESRLSSGELPNPDFAFMIRRECESLRKIGRLLSNLKERFLPLVIRDSYAPDTDALNSRESMAAEMAIVERLDPSIFLETLSPSKRKNDRVDLHISPTIVIVPAAGILAYSWNPRGGVENGRLAVPTCFIRQRIRERQLIYLMSDFRWDTAKLAAGMDVMMSDTLVAAFMTVRWDWRKRSREAREKGLIFNDQNDRTNWRRVYEAYFQTAMDGGKKLFNRNYDFYERIIAKYFDLPEGVAVLKKM